MSPRHNGLLENGNWEEIKQDSDLIVPLHSNISAWARAMKWIVDILRPSFLTRTTGPRPPVRRTAYLDGLRGFAAFIVYWHHHELWAHGLGGSKIFENAFGYDDKYYFVCLPGIRTFFTGGHYAVTVFFVLSGYVLCTKPLSLIHAGELGKLGDDLASALFRRWPRLHLPLIGTTFLYMTSWHLFGMWVDGKQENKYIDELWSYWIELKNFTFIFRTGGEPWFNYNFHLWSIPVEFKGSIIIYTALLAFSRCRRNARLLGEVMLIVYFMWIVDGWFGSMFMAGMLLCDLDLLALNNDLPRWFWKFEPFKELIFYNLLIVSIYLGGIPSFDSDVNTLRGSYGWYYLSWLKPQAVFDYKWFYLMFASAFLVASVPRIPWLKWFFETRFNQYLGRVSFSLYLMHGPVLWTIGDRLYAAVGYVREVHGENIPSWINAFPIPQIGPMGLEPSFFIPHIILLPLTLWLAEIVTRMFDEPSVRFAKWAYQRTLARSSKL